jgi:hypothetical protein
MAQKMTPSEMARSLFNKMIVDFNIDKWQSKECALVAVDVILNIDSIDKEYWEEVKLEIEKL